MPYTFNTPDDQNSMLESIGANSLDELFDTIPADLRLNRALDIPSAMSEIELEQHFASLSAENTSGDDKPFFLGGGCYDHFIPAVVDALASRGEFYTSYTPYQAEVSQGNLQAMFEYQTLICQLTGMDVSNASLYDGGSATIEAVLLAINATRRDGNIVVVESVHPEYRQVIDTYLVNLNAEVRTVAVEDGVVDPEEVAARVDENTACVVIQHPNFFGCLEDVESIARVAHDGGALLVQAFDPMSLGLLKNPGELGADICIAEGQCLGNPMVYGGPYLGIIASKQKHLRRLPGRIAGQTTAGDNQRCFVLTLQTREQHIRRQSATSNICTNQTLFALRATIYLSLMGPRGMRELGELCLRKSTYASRVLAANDRFELAFTAPFFKEFVVRDTDGKVQELLAAAERDGVMAGIWLGAWYERLSDCFLVTVTEKRTKQQIDLLGSVLAASGQQVETIHA